MTSSEISIAAISADYATIEESAELSPDSVSRIHDSHNEDKNSSSLDRRVIHDLKPISCTPKASSSADDVPFMTEEYFEDIQSVLDVLDQDDFFSDFSTVSRITTAPANIAVPASSSSICVEKNSSQMQIYEHIIAEAVGCFNRKDSESLVNTFYDKYCSNDVVTAIHQWKRSEGSVHRAKRTQQEMQEQHVLIQSKSSPNQNSHQVVTFPSSQRSTLVTLLNILFVYIPDAILCPTTTVNVQEDSESGNRRVFVKMSISGTAVHRVNLSKLNTLLPEIGKDLLLQHERLLVNGLQLNENQAIPKLTPPQMMNLPIAISTRIYLEVYLMLHFDEETNRIVSIEIHYFD
jgi:hypothetical protein